jgi:hypothetical protein
MRKLDRGSCHWSQAEYCLRSSLIRTVGAAADPIRLLSELLSAALPLDVRKGYAFPARILFKLEVTPPNGEA